MSLQSKMKLFLESNQSNYNPLYNAKDLVDHDAVGAIIRNKNNPNLILMMDHVKFNMMTIPVGKAESNQSPEDAVRQEVEEELGIKVKSMKLATQFKSKYRRNGIDVNVDGYLYEILDYSGIPKNNEPEKHRSIGWISIDEVRLIGNVTEMTQYALKYLK